MFGRRKKRFVEPIPTFPTPIDSRWMRGRPIVEIVGETKKKLRNPEYIRQGIEGERKIQTFLENSLPDWKFLFNVQFWRPFYHPSVGQAWTPTDWDIDIVAYGPAGIFVIDVKNATKEWQVNPERESGWIRLQAAYVRDVHLDAVTAVETPATASSPQITLLPRCSFVHVGYQQPYKYIGEKLYIGHADLHPITKKPMVNGELIDDRAIPVASPEELVEMMDSLPKNIPVGIIDRLFWEGHNRFTFLDPSAPREMDANGRNFQVPNWLKKKQPPGMHLVL